MIHLTALAQEAYASTDWPITTGSVGLPVELELSDDFDGLAVVVCFEAGSERVDVAYMGDPVTVPPQCLATSGVRLRIGVYALAMDGSVAIPTVWATCGVVRPGTVPDFDPYEPAPSWAAQVQQAAQEAKETAERLAADVDEWAVAEEARATAEEARVEAEGSRTAAESERATAEQARATAESARAGAEQSRITAEADRANAEAARAGAEADRASAETSRASAEEGRVVAETARAIAEAARAGAESARVTAEQLRQDAESSRASSEEARAAAETARATAETARASAESARANAEGARVTAENERASAESTRAQEWVDLKADAEAATEAAQEAATEVAPEVAWLWGNQLTGEVTGDILTAADAYSAPPMLVGIEGNSTQASTTGKNLFDKDNAPLGYYGNDGVFHSSGSGSSGYSWWSVRVSEGDVIRWADSTNNYLTGWNGGTFVQLSATRPTSPFTVPSGVDEVRGYTQNSTLSTCIVTKNNDNLTYEPYTGGKPSPNPDYPQEIVSVDELAVTFAGRNMVKDSDRESSLTTSNYARYDIAYMLADATQFTISVDAVVPSGQTLYLYCYDGVNNNSFGTMQLQSNGRYAITVTDAWYVSKFKSSKDVRIYSQPYTGGASVVTKISNCTLVVGTDAEYIPSDITTVPIDLQDHVLRSLPDGTKDELHLTYLRPSARAGWAVYSASLVQMVGHIVLTGTSPFNINSFGTKGINTIGLAVTGTSYTTNTNLHCDRYVAGQSGIYITSNGTYIGLTPPDGITDMASFNSWLANNNVSLDYPLATPVTTDLGEIELPVLPAPTCTVWADPTTGLQMEYVRDTSIVIANLEAAYADLATS